MSRYLSILILFMLFPITLISNEKPEQRHIVIVEYFFEPGCHECELIRKFVMPDWKENYSGVSEMKEYDIGVKKNFIVLAGLQEKLGIKENHPVTMIVNRKYVLGGYREIKEKLLETIDLCLSENLPPPVIENKDIGEEAQAELLNKRAEKMTLAAICIAGLLDGINPCVFSTLIFFMTLLAVSKVKDRELLLIGFVYCLACFLTYFVLGFGLFKAFKVLTAYKVLQQIFSFGFCGILVILAFISFRDAFLYHKTGDAKSVMLQLPDRIKTFIHSIMKRGLSFSLILPGIFLTGILVTLLESVCTGQVYIPTIVLMIKSGGETSKWIFYLLLYNVMFIIPLVFVFIAAWKGAGSKLLLDWSRRNVVAGKILVGVFFILLAALMLAF